MLELQAVVLKPGARPIDHCFQPGRISVVLGRNHSGKTLLTRVVAGLASPVSGDLLVDGQSIRDRSPGQRSVALVYQAFVNYPNWTVFENLASPLRARARRPSSSRPTEEEIRASVTSIAEKLQLLPLLDRYPDALSGGQQQRLAIGRALARSADVLVMDEPLVNLDYKLREALQLELRNLLHQSQMSVIYTTSDPRDAFALGDEVLLLSNHGLIQSGEPLALYEEPRSPEAADLMSDPRANRWQQDGMLNLVRPEDLHLQQTRPDDVAFSVEILGSETNGSETFVHCRNGEENAHWVARLEGLVALEQGARQTLYASVSSILPFEAS